MKDKQDFDFWSVLIFGIIVGLCVGMIVFNIFKKDCEICQECPSSIEKIAEINLTINCDSDWSCWNNGNGIWINKNPKGENGN